jgi:CRISPR-associated endonuclease/helicase Cas3
VLLACAIENALDPVLGGLGRGARRDLLAPYMGHHGRPVPLEQHGPESLFGDECLSLARAFVEVMRDLFQPPLLTAPPKGAIARVSWQLAGFAILADWISSSQTWFPYEPADHSAKRYWEIARRRAMTPWLPPA